ncbi:MAG: hypothetical protein ACI9VR_001014 [Cognaticolwellia sp.]|jgi:hypothetical protein
MHAKTTTYTLPQAPEQITTMLTDVMSGGKVCLEQNGEAVAMVLSMEEFQRLQARPKATTSTPGGVIQQVRRAGPEDAKAWKNAFAGVGKERTLAPTP